MKVDVHLHADLARLAPDASRGRISVDLPSAADVSVLLRALGVPEKRRIIVGVNDALAQADSELHDGDRVDVMTPMAGGTQPSVNE